MPSAWREAATRHKIELLLASFAALTLGLAPFVPHPHVYKQLASLARGELRAPIDILDLLLHGAPWIALVVVAIRAWRTARGLAAAR
jgi:hypothetical protein